MKPKNYWIGCFIFLLAGSAYGQVHLGATTAYNATFVLDKGLSDDPRYNSTYTYQLAPIGFNFGVDFGRKFGLQLESILSNQGLESILSNQGQIYDMINVAEQIAGQRKIDLQYINLPLMMKFMGGGNGKARTNFNFGPQMSILTKAVESIQANAGTFTIPTDLTFEDIQNDFPTAIFDQATGGYTLPGPVVILCLAQVHIRYHQGFLLMTLNRFTRVLLMPGMANTHCPLMRQQWPKIC